MRKLLVVLFSLFYITSFSQDLLNSRKTSYYTYIYKISNKEAKKVYKKNISEVDQSYFHTLVDSFPTDSMDNFKLQQGHYLRAFVNENQLEVDLLTIQNFDIRVLNNKSDLCIQVYDSTGNIMTNAKVKVDAKKIRFDEKSQIYRLKKSNKKGIVEVNVNNQVAFYNINRKYNNSKVQRIGKNIFYIAPVKFVWNPIYFVIRLPIDGVISIIDGYPRNTIYKTERFFIRSFEKIACLFDDYYCEDDYSSHIDGYFIFNKPKYHPKDTVKFKAFLLDKKGKPINNNLDVILYKDWSNKIKLTALAPYNDGGYAYEFYLHDSLDLKLDRNYTIYLKNKNNDKYKYESFKYEDYELTKSNLAIRTNDKSHFKGKEFKLYVKGTDENDMTLLDASYELLITNSNVHNYFSKQVFVRDTIYFIKQKLDPKKETEVVIPDSLFPPVNLDYSINVTLTTTDYEKLQKSEDIHYYHKYEDINFKLINDSILFKFYVNGEEKNTRATISGIDNFGNKILTKQISFPHKEKINPYYSFYKIETDSLQKAIHVDKASSQIQCLSERTKDSIHISINNPRNIPFNYYIYKLNKEILRGFSENNFQYSRKVNINKNYYVSLEYLWGGKVIEEDYEINFKDKELVIQVTQPRVIYPGQNALIEILTTDKSGNPVSDVDLTAYSLTKKFDYNSPNLPYLGKNKKTRKIINSFHTEDINLDNISIDLDYNQWKVLADIDSIEYFKFIYPGSNIYKHTYTAEDSITQFSPFILNNGKFQPIHVIYIDRRPVYFSWTNHKQPYSFRIDSGYHQIKLRTHNKNIIIDSLYFPFREKTIFSLNDTVSLQNIWTFERKNELTNKEKINLYNYILPYRHNFGERFAYLKQHEEFYLISSGTGYNASTYDRYNKYMYNENFTGPIYNNLVNFQLVGGFQSSFLFEPYYEYEFSPKLLKMRCIDKDSRFPRKLYYNTTAKLNDLVYTEKSINKDWETYVDNKRYSTARYNYPNKTSEGNGGLKLEINSKYQDENLIPLNVLLFKPSNPEFIRVYPGNINVINDLEKGFYRVIVFYSGSRYNLIDSIKVLPNGLNYIYIDNPKVYKKDNFSSDISNIIKEQIFKPNPYSSFYERNELNNINKKYNSEYLHSGLGYTVSGYVYGAEDGLSIPGTSVVVKGNPTIGTTTDIDGHYILNIPSGNSSLIFSFVGMETLEIAVNNQGFIDAALATSSMGLDEIIVSGVASGVSMASLGFSSSNEMENVSVSAARALQGKVSGVTVINNLNEAILIRGAVKLEASSSPLIIIDGVIYNGNLSDLDQNLITSMELIQDDALSGLYGSRAGNGVIQILTKNSSFAQTSKSIKGTSFDLDFLETASQASSIRDNFSDYAFWQPRLITNSKGKASFSVTFPDDVTNWNTYVLAMNGKKQTGQTQSEIKSFKPLMGQLSIPRFLIQGDTTFAIGKALNYTLDTIELSTKFELNDSIVFNKEQKCADAIIDSLLITPSNVDTINAKYYIKKPDGYFDGELREIPVFQKGLEQTKGNFFILDRDTSINLKFEESLGTVNLHARSDELEIIEVELKRLKNYKYLCNEQLASKLKAYIATETIDDFKNKKNKTSKHINRIIKKLEQNQNNKGYWGWWNRSNSSYWISIHVLEALSKAKQHNYKVNIDENSIVDNTISNLESNKSSSLKLRLLSVLKSINATVDYPRYIDLIEKDSSLTTQEKFNLIELKQLCNIEYNIKDVLDKKHETLFGNIYFESLQNEFSIDNNNIQITLIAYRVIKRDTSISDRYLSKIRNYLFEKRKNSYWGNTFESSQIIETILPDILNNKNSTGDQRIVLSGAINKTYDEFPVQLKLSSNDTITIRKTGKYPIYLTTYQRYWNPKPKRKENDFIISSHFENNNLQLNAGESEKLIVDVFVKKNAEYIMIEIPIPAGCSYNSKGKTYLNEIHREYYKNQVTIFSRRLNTGSYQFEIDLLPRYTGKYTLNPAKIELMYFPTYNANNESKKVQIKKK